MRFVYLFLFSKPFISVTSLFSTLTFGSFTSSFRFEPFISLYFFPLISSLTSASFASSFLTRPFHRVRPFVATLRFRFVTYFFPFRFNSSLLFPIPRSFRFKLFSSLGYFSPVVSTLPPCSLSFTILFVSRRSFCYFPSFCFNVFIQFVSLPFVSNRSFRYQQCEGTKHAAGLLECKGIRRLCEAQPRAQC